ncbi:MAG: rod shape-determining protein RodA [Cytophagaceae bacterium]|nr:rod shape-determining protein RodA [Cytophagaceae bacterium]
MRREDKLIKNIDWITVACYSILVFIGWLNIYAVVYNPDPEVKQNIFDLSTNSGKQLLWIASAALIIIFIFSIDYKFYSTFSYLLYAITILILGITIFLGIEVNNSRSWLGFGDLRVQPLEFAKITTALVVANYMSDINFKLNGWKQYLSVSLLVLAPCVLILLQKETGGLLAFSSFIIVMYREGLPGWILLLAVIMVSLVLVTLMYNKIYVALFILILGGLTIIAMTLFSKRTRNVSIFRRSIMITAVCLAMISVVYSVDFFFYKILQPHQQKRILILLHPELDKKNEGYQINQSKVAIGSGGLWGKGFLQGTQTKFDFVPEQSTDFIFCTIGEEHGWIGSSFIIGLYVFLLSRIVWLAERQKDRFARIYGYSVASILFFHFTINIGMTIGLFPIIGIPLPFFSYGGSSLWAFTILLFIFLKLDAHRKELLAH